MRIGIDGRCIQDHFPGIGRYVLNLARALAQIAPDLDIALLHDPAAVANLSLPDLPRMACPVSPFSIRQQWIVPGALRRAQATLYHSPYYLMPYRPGVPTVLTCYDLIPLLYPQYYSATHRLIYRLAHVLALQASHQILAISEATRADLIRYFHLDPQRVIATLLAAGPSFRPQPPVMVAALRARLNLPERCVLYLGSNKPHKNLVRLVEAWGSLQPQPVPLVIAGVWDTRYPEAQQRAEALALGNAIHFLGPVTESDLPALYSGALLFVFPSEYEGFGLPVLEAIACGTPVTCSNASSLPEVAGDAALMFDPTNVDAIASALNCLLADADLRADLRERGLRQAARFTWDRTGRETLSVYMELAK